MLTIPIKNNQLCVSDPKYLLPILLPVIMKISKTMLGSIFHYSEEIRSANTKEHYEFAYATVGLKDASLLATYST